MMTRWEHIRSGLRSFGLLAALAAAALQLSCGKPESAASGKTGALSTPRQDLRATPSGTIAQAIEALEKGQVSLFPSLLSLALELKHPGEILLSDEPAALEAADFEKVAAALRAARELRPRFTHGGKVATYEIAGHGLRHDRLRLINHQGKWYFLVE